MVCMFFSWHMLMMIACFSGFFGFGVYIGLRLFEKPLVLFVAQKVWSLLLVWKHPKIPLPPRLSAEISQEIVLQKRLVMRQRLERELAMTRKFLLDSEGLLGVAKRVACVSMTDGLLEARAKIARAHSMLEFYREAWKENEDEIQLLSNDMNGDLDVLNKFACWWVVSITFYLLFPFVLITPVDKWLLLLEGVETTN